MTHVAMTWLLFKLRVTHFKEAWGHCSDNTHTQQTHTPLVLTQG